MFAPCVHSTISSGPPASKPVPEDFIKDKILPHDAELFVPCEKGDNERQKSHLHPKNWVEHETLDADGNKHFGRQILPDSEFVTLSKQQIKYCRHFSNFVFYPNNEATCNVADFSIGESSIKCPYWSHVAYPFTIIRSRSYHYRWHRLPHDPRERYERKIVIRRSVSISDLRSPNGRHPLGSTHAERRNVLVVYECQSLRSRRKLNNRISNLECTCLGTNVSHGMKSYWSQKKRKSA